MKYHTKNLTENLRPGHPFEFWQKPVQSLCEETNAQDKSYIYKIPSVKEHKLTNQILKRRYLREENQPIVRSNKE